MKISMLFEEAREGSSNWIFTCVESNPHVLQWKRLLTGMDAKNGSRFSRQCAINFLCSSYSFNGEPSEDTPSVSTNEANFSTASVFTIGT